jgi:hypothetical protein
MKYIPGDEALADDAVGRGGASLIQSFRAYQRSFLLNASQRPLERGRTQILGVFHATPELACPITFIHVEFYYDES